MGNCPVQRMGIRMWRLVEESFSERAGLHSILLWFLNGRKQFVSMCWPLCVLNFVLRAFYNINTGFVTRNGPRYSRGSLLSIVNLLHTR
jgi:hypothetical protein